MLRPRQGVLRPAGEGQRKDQGRAQGAGQGASQAHASGGWYIFLFSFSLSHLLTGLVAASCRQLCSSPFLSVVTISSNSPLEYGKAEDVAHIRKDGYLFQTPSFPAISGDAATLAESFLAVYKANAATFKMLRGLANHQAAEAEVEAAHEHYCAAQCALRISQLKVNAQRERHLKAWQLLEGLFGKGPYHDLGCIPTSRTSSQAGRSTRSASELESESYAELGDNKGVEWMLE